MYAHIDSIYPPDFHGITLAGIHRSPKAVALSFILSMKRIAPLPGYVLIQENAKEGYFSSPFIIFKVGGTAQSKKPFIFISKKMGSAFHATKKPQKI